eukprot:6488095-Amphidinium_carterae.1
MLVLWLKCHRSLDHTCPTALTELPFLCLALLFALSLLIWPYHKRSALVSTLNELAPNHRVLVSNDNPSALIELAYHLSFP